MKRMKKIITIPGLLLLTMFFNQECQSQTPSTTPPAPGASAPAAPLGAAPTTSESAVKAVAKFSGTAPVMPKLKREADPFCGKTPMTDQEVVVNPNGTLKNVVVRVSQGAPAGATVPADPIMLDQSNCMYTPRVIAGMAGQKLMVHNSDPILHNVHTYVGAATGFNQAQMKGSKPIEKTIAAGLTKFKCDVHPWMTGYSYGNDNPYVCVTNDTGGCDLKGLPAGTYTLEAWHEKYGTKTSSVTVVAGQPANVEFGFSATP